MKFKEIRIEIDDDDYEWLKTDGNGRAVDVFGVRIWITRRKVREAQP